MENSMINPINQKFKTKLVDKIPSSKVILKYNNEFQFDVSSYFFGIEFIEIYECEITNYRFYYPFSIIGDGDFYINLSKEKGNYYHKRWEHKIALTKAKKGERWLEIGSGNSYFLKELTKGGVSALGLELNSEEVIRAENENFEVRDCDFFSFDCKKGEYDAIALFQVLEHIKDISTFFIHARELLKNNGKLIIGVPNNNPYLYVFDKYHCLNLPPHHMGLWTGKSLKNVGSSFGFSVKELQYEPLSHLELDYILDLYPKYSLSIRNLKFFLLKAFRRLFPVKVYRLISFFYRKFLVNGRNILVVFEKND